MASLIEDYALIGDTHTAALVGKDGSIDWLCLPRFDAGACFAALVGEPGNGRWCIAPRGDGSSLSVRRRYRGSSLILETEYQNAAGAVRLIDFMPPRDVLPVVVRIVEGIRGRVDMQMELTLRFDYGRIVPWVRSAGPDLLAVAGPDGVVLRTPVETRGVDLRTLADFAVGPGERIPFVLSWHPSHQQPPPPVDAEKALAETGRYWHDWSASCELVDNEWRGDVMRSLITLKALTYAPTGGIVAVPTTSLPEQIGGTRNWDYRFCWLRDASLTLDALMGAGYRDEAVAWRNWLLRAVAGSPGDLQIMYGPSGERRLTELELPWLSGYEGSVPVRVGNDAHGQLQLDVYGEVIDALYRAREAGEDEHGSAWALQEALLNHLEGSWHKPDNGIWEVRAGPKPFTSSRVMVWVAFDRMIRTAESKGAPRVEPEVLARWRAVRDEVHSEVCTKAYDPEIGAFTQYYGSTTLDASVLQIPLVGFLPPDDPRVRTTVSALEDRLLEDGLLRRYDSEDEVDGLPPGEGAFLACTFWLAECQARLGRVADGVATFERVLDLRNDVGLLSEEYDQTLRRMVGNFPQAFSHIGLVATARTLSSVPS